jgi:hypothetical protein
MKAKTSQAPPSKSVQPSKPVRRDINPRFKDRLPGIMTEICDGLVVIEPAIDRINIQLREFLDFLDFEIRKVDLEIKEMEWKSVVDRDAYKEAVEWKQQLVLLMEDFNVEAMTSPPENIRAMVARVSRMFGV